MTGQHCNAATAAAAQGTTTGKWILSFVYFVPIFDRLIITKMLRCLSCLREERPSEKGQGRARPQ